MQDDSDNKKPSADSDQHQDLSADGLSPTWLSDWEEMHEKLENADKRKAAERAAAEEEQRLELLEKLTQAVFFGDRPVADALIAEGAAASEDLVRRVHDLGWIEWERLLIATLPADVAANFNPAPAKKAPAAPQKPLNQRLQGKLADAVQQLDPDKAKTYISKGAQPTPDMLIYAVVNAPDAEITSLLLENGGDPDSHTRDNTTVLMLATKDYKSTTLKLLLDHGAQIEARNDAGDSALIYAAGREDSSAASILLEHGANIRARNKKGDTPLIRAAGTLYSGTVQLLLDHDADVNEANDRGITPLMAAAAMKNAKAAKILLENGADFRMKDHDGRTALDIAREVGDNNEVIRLITDAEMIDTANAHTDDPAVRTAILTDAVNRGSKPAINTLLESGVEPTEEMLRTAIQKDKRDIFYLLGPHIKSAPGEKTLLAAVNSGQSWPVAGVLELGAKPTQATLLAAVENNRPLLTMLLTAATIVPGKKVLAAAVEKRDTTAVKNLIIKGAKPTPDILSQAVKDRAGSMISLLMSGDIKPTSENLSEILDARWFDLAGLCVEKGAKPTNEMFHRAIELHDGRGLKILLASDVKPDEAMLARATTDNWFQGMGLLIQAGVTPTNEILAQAIASNNNDTAAALTAGDFTPSAENLAATLAHGWFNLSSSLVKKGAVATTGMLHDAVAHNDQRSLDIILASGTTPDEEALKTAVDANWLYGTKDLIAAGAKPTNDMLDKALATKNSDMATILLAGNFTPNTENLATAISANWLSMVEKLTIRGAKPTNEMVRTVMNDPEKSTFVMPLLTGDFTPDEQTLTLAINKGWDRAVKVIVQKNGAKPTSEMLRKALEDNNGSMLSALLATDIVPDEKALALAVEKGNNAAVKAFIERGSKPTSDMLYTAVVKQNHQLLAALIAGDVIPDEKTLAAAVDVQWGGAVEAFLNMGATPTSGMLHTAVKQAWAIGAGLLVDKGAPVTSEMLVTALDKDDTEIFGKLITADMTPDASALTAAVRISWIAAIKTMMKKGAKPDTQTFIAAAKNQSDALPLLLDGGITPEDATAALAAAVSSVNTDAIDMLIEKGAVANNAMLTEAIRYGESYILDRLLATPVTPDEENLLAAIECDWYEAVETMLDKGAAATTHALSLAVKRGNEDITTLLTGAGAKPDEETLAAAVNARWYDTVSSFISKGVTPGAQSLIAAVHAEDSYLLEEFLDCKVDPAAASAALTEAVRCQYGDGVDIFMAKGVAPDEAALSAAVVGAWYGAVRLLLDNGAVATTGMLNAAIGNGDENTFNLLAKSGAVPDEKTLARAVDNCWDDAVKTFIGKGIKPTTEMLHDALARGDELTLNTLITGDIKPDAQTMIGAVDRGWDGTISTLIWKGGEVTNTMLRSAIANEEPAVLDALLAGDVVPDKQTIDLAETTGSAYAEAIFKKIEEVMDAAKADAGKKDAVSYEVATAAANMRARKEQEQKNAELISAIKEGYIEKTQKLLAEGANANTMNEKGETPIFWAAKGGSLDLVKILLENGADVNHATVGTSSVSTPLMAAVKAGHTNVVKLLAPLSNINARYCVDGSTALMYAAQNGKIELVQALLSEDANPLMENNKGQTAADIAAATGNRAVADVLKRAAAVYPGKTAHATGELVENEGVYIGTYEVDTVGADGKSLTKVFNVYAAPEDLKTRFGRRACLTYDETTERIKGLSNWHGHDGAPYTTEEQLTAALANGTYVDGWVVPTNDVMRNNIVPNNFSGELYGSFAPEQLDMRDGAKFPDYYFSMPSTPYGLPEITKLCNLVPARLREQFMEKAACRPVRFVETKVIKPAKRDAKPKETPKAPAATGRGRMTDEEYKRQADMLLGRNRDSIEQELNKYYYNEKDLYKRNSWR